MAAQASLAPPLSCSTEQVSEMFRQGMRRLAGACTIITTRVPGQGRAGWAGMAATAVTSVTAEPPRLLVCINRSTWAHGVIGKSGVLGVNVLAAEGLETARCFAGGVPPEDRFVQGEWQAGRTGAPLLSSALASFDCAVSECIAASTHDIFICDVLDVRLRDTSGEPLIYFDGAFIERAPGQPNPTTNERNGA